MPQSRDRFPHSFDPFDEQRMHSVSFYIEAQTRTPSFCMPMEHMHSALEFYYLRSGHCLYIINGAYVQLTAGDIIIVPAGVSHSSQYTGSTPSERITVYINTKDLPEQLLRQVDGLSDLLSVAGKRITDKGGNFILEDILQRIAREQCAPGRNNHALQSVYVSELLLQTLNHSVPAGDAFISVKKMEPDIEHALHIIDTRFRQPLSLNVLAAELRMNPVYLSHKFKLVTGYTFKEYLNNARIRSASHQLLICDDSITKIALDNGFSGSNYFKDLFRRYMGCSPREYRRRLSGSAEALWNDK